MFVPRPGGTLGGENTALTPPLSTFRGVFAEKYTYVGLALSIVTMELSEETGTAERTI